MSVLREGADGEEAPEGFARVTAGEVEWDAMHPFMHPSPDLDPAQAQRAQVHATEPGTPVIYHELSRSSCRYSPLPLLINCLKRPEFGPREVRQIWDTSGFNTPFSNT